VESASGRTPFLSANDRSRWSTIRALVDEGTFELDRVIFRDGGEQQRAAALDPTLDPIRRRDSDWYSIDLVRHRGRDGREHAYSSKPPLLSVMLAAVYWCVRAITGATLATHPFYVGRIMLVITNVLPLAFAWWLLSRLVERFGKTDWGRLLVMTTATWATLLSPMAVTLNNHLPAAVCVTVLVYALVRITESSSGGRRWFALAGLAAGLLAACELPALSASALAGAALLLASWRSTLCAFLPPALLVAGAAIGTNILAHDTWRPAYSQRHDGPVIATLTGFPVESLPQPDIQTPVPAAIRQSLAAQTANAEQISDEAVVRAAGEQRWRIWDPATDQRWVIRRPANHVAAASRNQDAPLELRRWGNWYEYEGSYWSADRLQGVDRGEPSRLTYAFHVLVGHHGVFSLTPVWLLSLASLAYACCRPRAYTDPNATVTEFRGPHAVFWQRLLWSITLLVFVCLCFYLQRPLIDRNYGGVSCGFRWLFWFIPLWLLAALPAADWSGRTWLGRALTLGLLALSIYSAQWSALSPWSHPWLFHP
jgi:hypothetical protein